MKTAISGGLGTIGVLLIAAGMLLPHSAMYVLDTSDRDVALWWQWQPTERILPDSTRTVSVVSQVFGFTGLSELTVPAVVAFVVAVPILLWSRRYTAAERVLVVITLVNMIIFLMVLFGSFGGDDRAILNPLRSIVLWPTWIILLFGTGMAFTAVLLGKRNGEKGGRGVSSR